MTEIVKIIGMSVKRAETLLKKHGFILRVMERDGEHFVGTCEMRTNRVNVVVENGKITGLLQVG